MITTVKLESTSAIEQNNVPVTFGQVFAAGDLPDGESIVGMLEDGTVVPMQVDVKASHADGSVRHAAISAVLGALPAQAEVVLGMAVAPSNTVPVAQSFPPAPAVAVIVDLEGVRYSANRNEDVSPRAWIEGAIVNERHSAVELSTADGTKHPHLVARFGIRVPYVGPARVEVVLENNWAYEPEPRNFTYDYAVIVDGQIVEQAIGLVHYHHARWRGVYWVGGNEPAVHVRHNARYLIDSGAAPNYDLSVQVNEATLVGYLAKWNALTVGPMKIGPLVQKGMPTTGGRDDLGLMPGWAAAYLISQDERAKVVTLRTADMAGSWPIHYRDKNTDQPISVIDYPYMTLLGIPGDTYNPVTKQREAFPLLDKKANPTPYIPDTAHQPAFSYLPYLVTAEHYYLEELQFWCMWNIFQANPGYRGNVKGLLHSNQVRGQAWNLRTLAETAYITPDDDRLKAHLVQILDNNIEWYSSNYLEGGKLHNNLGVITNGNAATGYKDETDELMPKTAVAPWQDDFNTSAWGRVVELHPEKTKAQEMLCFKAKFPIGRLVGDGVCWLAGANYTYVVRATESGPIYETFAEAYRDTVGEAVAALPCGDQVAAALGHKPGDMGGYSSSVAGFPSNMQPALAYAANTGAAGRRAWNLFMSRSIKPNYGSGPQFAILPRVATDVVEIEPVPPVEPTPDPVPVPLPTPDPTPEPTPDPQPEPEPEPTPVPDPVPTPVEPTPEPLPDPAPQPVPDPAPEQKGGIIAGLTLTVFDPATLQVAPGEVSMLGIDVVQGAALIDGKLYAASLADAGGRVIKVMFPLVGIK